MVSYRAMSEAADIISREIRTRKAKARNIAIYDAQVVRDWRFYKALFPAFEGQVNDFSTRYRNELCRLREKYPNEKFVSEDYFNNHCPGGVRTSAALTAGIQTAFAAGTNLLKSFVDLTALFRTETKIQGVSFTVEESALSWPNSSAHSETSTG